ncbi:MAG: AarF/ABC1/UbiB kinase family protein [archaeon]|nr:AarF/ABC1/UbiB kinase family protein [archaeon]
MSTFKKEKISANRVALIAKCLVKYGFRSAAESIGMRMKIPLFSKRLGKISHKYGTHQRTKMLLEDLGPTFVKLGQIISTRPDLVGEELCEELATLQDSVEPFSYEEVEEVFKAEFGKPIDSVFKSFERIPMASASLAQVHKAVTKDGKVVAVKVQRPNIEEIIRQDIQIMHYIAELAEKRNPDLKKFGSPEIIEEFERGLQKELNFNLEGKNILRFREIFKDDLNVVIPEYFEELSTGRILTMGYVEGTPLTEILAGKTIPGINKPLIAKISVKAYFKQLLEHGFFHADLHPGNIFVNKNKIGFVDFGLIGWLEQSKIDDLSRLFINLIDCDVGNILIQLSAMDLIAEDTDLVSLREDISDLMETYYGLEMKQVNLGKSATDLMVLLAKHKIRIPKEYILLSRSLLLVESSAKALDPDFSAIEIFQPYLLKLAINKFTPKEIFKRLKLQIFDIDSLSRTLPKSIRNILKIIEGGKVKLEFEHKNLDIFAAQLDKIMSRLVVAIILASIVVGSSIAMVASNNLPIYGLPTLSVLGFFVALALGFVLVVVSLKNIAR